MNKLKPKIYLITCYKCKKQTEEKQVIWVNRLPICAHCMEIYMKTDPELKGL